MLSAALFAQVDIIINVRRTVGLRGPFGWRKNRTH
jgi:hypothetical protein